MLISKHEYVTLYSKIAISKVKMAPDFLSRQCFLKYRLIVLSRKQFLLFIFPDGNALTEDILLEEMPSYLYATKK